MSVSTCTAAVRLGDLLLSHPDTLDAELFHELAAPVGLPNTPPEYSLKVLGRTELTSADAQRIVDNISSGPRHHVTAQMAGALLARLPLRHMADLKAQARRITGGRHLRKAELAELIRHPLVSDHVLDMLAEAADPFIVATYAYLTPRGTPARIDALTHLESLLAPVGPRVKPETAEHAARALSRLLCEDGEAGRAALLATHARPVLLALGMEQTPWDGKLRVTDRLDAETRAHIVRRAILPALEEQQRRRRDEDLAVTLLNRIRGNLDLDLLKRLVELLPSRRTGMMRAEISRRSTEGHVFAYTNVSVGGLLLLGESDRGAGAEWFIDELGDAAKTIGWSALLRLANQTMEENTTLIELRDVLRSVATPAGTTTPPAPV